MKSLIISLPTDKYKQGNYYDDWLNEIKSQLSCEIYTIGNTQSPPLTNYDFIILGHSFIDYCVKQCRFKSINITNDIFIDFVIRKNILLRNIQETNATKILFSKNDYKNIKLKSLIMKFLGIKSCITHSLSSYQLFDKYKKLFCNTEIFWLPFGVDEKNFINLNKKRFNRIGFRGNLNSKYNNNTRKKIIEDCYKFFGKDSEFLDIKFGPDNFLNIKEYCNWMNTITLCLNTESAIGTVGPKFWEQMICGVVPLAPISNYEGLLKPRLNYLPINIHNKNWLNEIEIYLNDPYLLSEIKNENFKMVENFTVKNLCSTFKSYLSKLK